MKFLIKSISFDEHLSVTFQALKFVQKAVMFYIFIMTYMRVDLFKYVNMLFY